MQTERAIFLSLGTTTRNGPAQLSLRHVQELGLMPMRIDQPTSMSVIEALIGGESLGSVVARRGAGEIGRSNGTKTAMRVLRPQQSPGKLKGETQRAPIHLRSN